MSTLHEEHAPKPGRISPDEEAMRLMIDVARRAQVAKSFAKLAGGLLTVSAAQASLHLRAVADAKLTEMKRLAQAAKDAAVHVAKQRAERTAKDVPDEQTSR